MQKQKDEAIREVERQGWTAEKIATEASNKESDEIVRQMARGDETNGDADERDIAGGPENAETPQGREETKKNQSGAK